MRPKIQRASKIVAMIFLRNYHIRNVEQTCTKDYCISWRAYRQQEAEGTRESYRKH